MKGLVRMVSHMAWSHLHLPSVTQHLKFFNSFSEIFLFCQLYRSGFLEKENKIRLGFFEDFFCVRKAYIVFRSTDCENTKRQDSATCAGGICNYFYLLCTPTKAKALTSAST